MPPHASGAVMGGTPAQPVTIDAITYVSLRDAARQLGVAYPTLRNRLRRGGLSPQQLVSADSVRQYKRKTYCKRGHLLELTGRVVGQKGSITRQCRACHRDLARERYRRKKAAPP